MADFDWMLGVIMLSGFLFAAIARFNLHRYAQYKRVPADFDNQHYLEALESSSPETILDDGLHQLFKYVMAGMIVFLVASTTLVSILFD